MSNNMGTQNASVYWTGYEIHSCLKIWATKISCVLDKGYTSYFPCMMIPEAKSTFSFLFDSVVQYIQILWDF